MTLSDSKKTNGEPVVSSGPVKPVDQTDMSSGGDNSKKSEGVSLAPSTPVKPIGNTGASSSIRIGGRGKAYVSHGGKGKAIASDSAREIIAFKDAKLGPHEGELQFRLIHFWEAWNTLTKVLIGLEMLLIDRESKPNYRVADPDVTISFSWNSVLSELVDNLICFPADRFLIHGFGEFDAVCDMKGALYDYIGHIKLVNGQVPSDSLLIDETNIAASRRVDLHVQTHDDPVLKLCLWTMLLLNSGKSLKHLEALPVLSWLSSNQDVANRLKADVVVKPEKATLGELFSYMKRASGKVAWFECTATIDDVVHGSKWYYIGCGECHTKATKGPTTLMCKKCGKNEVVGVAQYLAKLSVYDHNDDQAFFVLLGDAGEELTGKKAAELVESYYEANDGVGDDDIVPVPQVLIDTIGQKRTFMMPSVPDVADDVLY
ncbi:hypothetical protein Bca101_027413 [Brassica carinata]